MYQIGDQVVYGFHGVCRIVGIEQRVVNRKSQQYYVLEPMGSSGSQFFIPTDNQAALEKLRPILSKQELEAILSTDSVRQDVWIPDENRRKQCYRDLIKSGDCAGIMTMVNTLRQRRQEQKAAGRKFHLCDENFLRDAEKLICSEVSVVMEIPADAVPDYLIKHLEVS